ncbi:MAG: WXG100 family type VII secretion target [Clostridia bacterium]|nr:WXG100 family type VII secretion target [Clostridia bacterium]
MPTPSEIRRKAKRINTVNDELRRAKDRCQGYTYNSSSWWQSDAGKTLRSEYSEIQVVINKLLSKMSRLEASTNNLARYVQQADYERRRKAEEPTRSVFAVR